MTAPSAIQSMKLEFDKSKRMPASVIVLGIIAINLAYLFIGTSKEDIVGLPQAWESVFFYLPLMNTIFVSLFMAYLASKNMDLEHKGHTWNILLTLQSRFSLYAGKVIYGFYWVSLYAVLEIAATVILSKIMGMEGFPDLRMVITTLAGTILGGMTVYNLQLILSMIFKNQFASLSVSACGTLTGFFMMYVTDNAFLPWSVTGALRSLNMDYDDIHKISVYTPYTAPISSWIIAAVYILGFFAIGHLLFAWLEEDHLTIHPASRVRSEKLNTLFPAEMIKLKRSPVWIPFLVMPAISALIGVFNFTNNQGVLHFTWKDLWTQQSLFLGLLFLAPLTGVLCSLLWRMEHAGTNWNIILTVESAYKIVKDKLLISSCISILCILWIGVLYVISGTVLGIPGSIPVEFYECMLCGALGCVALSAVQIYLSLVIRSFALPVGIAFIGNIAGLAFISKGFGFFLPYAMIQMGLKSTNLTYELDAGKFAIACGLYLVLFYGMSVIHIKRSDVKTGQ